jgi:16S rRNA (uracil1498-N3)-methyltransferase
VSSVTARFYATAAAASGERIRLPDDEAVHLVRVLRLGRGDVVRVFNGRGAMFEAVVAEVGRDGVVLVLGAPCAAAPEPRVPVTLAVAVLRGDRMDEVVRDAAMIGAAAIQPFVTARTETSLAALARTRRVARWQRVAIASVKQCGRAVVPPVHDPCDLAGLLERIADGRLQGPAILLVEPGAGSGRRVGDLAGTPPPAATLVIGPEGGWAPQELARAMACCEAVTLGHRTLRADATPLVALSALFTHWREF